MKRTQPTGTCRKSRIGQTPKALATRARLLDAAMRVIAQDGFHAANNARVAQVAKVVRGVINYHFPTPDRFLEGLVAHIEQRKGERLAQMAGDLRGASGEHVDAAIDAYWALLHEEPFLAFAELEDAARTIPALRALLAGPRGALDHSLTTSGPLATSEVAGEPTRQALYDFSRFLLEGLSRGALTDDRAGREQRLIELLKHAVKALSGAQAPRPVWMD